MVDKEAYLVGGLNQNNVHEIFKFNLETETFQEMEYRPETNFPRFHHTTVMYKKALFIYGGEKYTEGSSIS